MIRALYSSGNKKARKKKEPISTSPYRQPLPRVAQVHQPSKKHARCASNPAPQRTKVDGNKLPKYPKLPERCAPKPRNIKNQVDVHKYIARALRLKLRSIKD